MLPETFDRKADIVFRILACIAFVLIAAIFVGGIFGEIGKFLIKQDTVVCIAAIAGFALTIVIATVVGTVVFFFGKDKH